MMKKTLLATALMAASTATMAEISGNVALATDYVFRGFSQTDNQMALQGGLDYAHESGFYIGTWASNVDSDFFNTTSSTTRDPQLELDVYAGYSGELANGIGYDLGVLHYDYPGYSDADTDEIYVSGSYKGFSASLNYSDELSFIGSDQSAWYLKGAYETTLPWYEVGFSAHLGYNYGDAYDVSDSDRLKGDTGFYDSYTDWSIGFSKAVYGVDLGLTYTDLDLDSKDDCKKDYCDSKVVFSVSKSL